MRVVFSSFNVYGCSGFGCSFSTRYGLGLARAVWLYYEVYYALSTKWCLQVLHDVLRVVLQYVLHLHCTVLKTVILWQTRLSLDGLGLIRSLVALLLLLI